MMGDKRKVTMIFLTLILDGEFSKDAVELAFLPDIRRACLRDDMMYAPEAWIDSMETKEMEIISRRLKKEAQSGKSSTGKNKD